MNELTSTSEFLSLEERIKQLIAVHGGLRAAATAIGIDAAYLKRLRDGERLNPQPIMLSRLGLREVRTYKLIRGETA